MKLSLVVQSALLSTYFAIFTAVSAQTINITGKVVDGSSKPIKDAAVHLLKADKFVRTNENGEFTITSNSPPVSVSRHSLFHFSDINQAGATLNIDAVFNLKGARVASSGSNENALHQFLGASGIFITQTQSRGRSYFNKLISRAASPTLNISSGKPSGSSQVLAKTAASDVLVVSALGKTQQRMDISDLGKDVGTIKLSGGKGEYHGYTQLIFNHAGKKAYIVLPKTPHPAKPWIWRAIFWNDSPEVDLRLLSKGYYLVHIEVKNMHGNDKSMEIGGSFQDMLVNYLGFWKKGVVSGWSRGGFFIFRYSSKNADRVSVVFADAATCNWRAWPKKPIWGMSKQEAENFKENPSDSAIVKPLVDGKVAVVHEILKGDKTVTNDWTYTMQELYQDMGGVYTILERTKGSHVTHGTKEEEIEAFILKYNPVEPPIQ